MTQVIGVMIFYFLGEDLVLTRVSTPEKQAGPSCTQVHVPTFFAEGTRSS